MFYNKILKYKKVKYLKKGIMHIYLYKWWMKTFYKDPQKVLIVYRKCVKSVHKDWIGHGPACNLVLECHLKVLANVILYQI